MFFFFQFLFFLCQKSSQKMLLLYTRKLLSLKGVCFCHQKGSRIFSAVPFQSLLHLCSSMIRTGSEVFCFKELAVTVAESRSCDNNVCVFIICIYCMCLQYSCVCVRESERARERKRVSEESRAQRYRSFQVCVCVCRACIDCKYAGLNKVVITFVC